ncbi:acyl-CoA dehydrogenase family protein [Mesoterricola sediminis]|uniref:Acyl-[acyl-carrier-protein] dehydrogenase MbtN n=1 Tax=Mesoterricola sediminis TaxID=2927980 RepID=A0AA48KCW3_9BACT|nr:acyl-CoA dehydrogenase family protein [Mesoterricola sediminis]BDU76460.1 acyl-CoA dehydrogenase [Mesoterricola sediminis]
MDEELVLFRDAVAKFIHKTFVPCQERWRAQHHPDPDAWRKAGEAGLLLVDLPEASGGGGGTFRHEAVVIEELARASVNFANYIQDGVAHYLHQYGSAEQQARWLPDLASGARVGAIALTEPGGGSDLQGLATSARRDGDQYVLNGSKTFITNGTLMNLLVVAVRTDPAVPALRGISLLVFETDGLPGFHKGRPLEKVGMNGQDTCEAFFDEVRVPASSLLGPREGQGFAQIMDRMVYERLAIAVGAAAAMERAIELTSEYVKERGAYGGTLMDLQNTRMVLAECATRAKLGRVFVDGCIDRYVAGRLDPVTAAQAKYWLTESECLVADACVQLHGGYGYMTEYEIARIWADSRVHRIYGGANEILKEMIAWSL